MNKYKQRYLKGGKLKKFEMWSMYRQNRGNINLPQFGILFENTGV
jgi:hypothetical protein